MLRLWLESQPTFVIVLVIFGIGSVRCLGFRTGQHRPSELAPAL
jgi:hypothetical protein